MATQNECNNHPPCLISSDSFLHVPLRPYHSLLDPEIAPRVPNHATTPLPIFLQATSIDHGAKKEDVLSDSDVMVIWTKMGLNRRCWPNRWVYFPFAGPSDSAQCTRLGAQVMEPATLMSSSIFLGRRP